MKLKMNYIKYLTVKEIMDQEETQKLETPAVKASEEKVEMNREFREFAIMCNLLPLCQMILWFFPGVNVLAPLIFWRMKRKNHPEFDEAAKEIINLQIIFFICKLIALGLCFVTVGFFMIPMLFIIWVFFIILPVNKIVHGERFKYPFMIRFIK